MSPNWLSVGLALVATLCSSPEAVSAFVAPRPNGAAPHSPVVGSLAAGPDGEKDPNNLLETFFTGGAFDGRESEAAEIASKIRSAKDLGWTAPAKRRGSTRPRHRAFGGSTELPVQLKANYDESSPNCVEKWLTQDEFYSIVRTDGPAADTVFVALAGGGAFAERDVCEARLKQWRSGGPKGDAFDEGAFLKSVNEGRTGLGIGWGLFLSLNGLFVSGIVFPTNPFMKALEGALEELQNAY